MSEHLATINDELFPPSYWEALQRLATAWDKPSWAVLQELVGLGERIETNRVAGQGMRIHAEETDYDGMRIVTTHVAQTGMPPMSALMPMLATNQQEAWRKLTDLAVLWNCTIPVALCRTVAIATMINDLQLAGVPTIDLVSLKPTEAHDTY